MKSLQESPPRDPANIPYEELAANGVAPLNSSSLYTKPKTAPDIRLPRKKRTLLRVDALLHLMPLQLLFKALAQMNPRLAA